MKLLRHKKGMNMGGLIGFVIAGIVAIIVIPIWITSYNSAAGNFSASEQSLLGLVSLLLVVGLIVGALAIAGVKFGAGK